MSSTDIDAPPLRLIIMAIVIVVGLHVLTAVALVAMKPSEPKIKLPENTTPIEIEMVTLPAAIEVSKNELSKNEVQDTQPVEVPKTPSKSVAIDEVKPKPQPVEKPTPVEQPNIEQPNTVVKAPVKQEPNDETSELKSEANKQPEKPKTIEYEPFSHHVTLPDSASMEIVDKSPTTNELKMLTAKAKANAEAQAKLQEAERVNKAIADAIEEKAAEAKAAKEKVAEANAARVSAEAAAAAATANNTPVNFTASNANWASAPNFSFPERAARRARSGDILNVVLVLRVNKQGGIDSVRIAQSSGNAIVDKEAQRQVRSGKFKPFTKSGAPVVGNVTLPISYEVP